MPCQKNHKPTPTIPSREMAPLPDFWLPVFWKNQFRTTIELPTRIKYPQVQGSTAIITGSNTGLGFEASKQLLSLGLSHLIMGVRSLERGKVAAEKLKMIAPSASIDVWQLDMQSYDSIQAFAKKCDTEISRIDFVILNAGISPSNFELVPGTGHEVGIQVNHLSTALLTILLIPILKAKTSGHGPPRLTTVNSLTAHLCKFPNKDERPLLASFDDPKITPWSSQERYGVSKLLNQLFLVRLCEKVNPNDVIINMVDPGLTKGTHLGGHHEMGGVAGALVGAFMAICGRPVDRGAASYTNAVYGHGKDSHGCFLMSCEIAPLACWFYKHGDILVDQVWNETLEELDFAGVKGIISGQSSRNQSFTFITQTPFKKSKEIQRLVRSRARSNSARKDQSQVTSWILNQKEAHMTLQVPDGTIPGRVGTNFSLLDFPEPLQAYMENDLFLSFHGMRGSLYPTEICLQIDEMKSSWTTNLLVDQVYFHSIMFSVEAYFDMLLGREYGSLAHFHFLKTLRLLQARINNPTDPTSISDATIMVVVILGLAAEMIGDRTAAENHAAGMARIVDLRGGLEMLRFDNPRLPAKVCRVDIGLALRFGCKPVFFDQDISWNPYLSSQSLVRRKKKLAGADHAMMAFLKTLDPRLSNVWKDLEEFAKLSNIASQTSRKLQPNIFSEAMVSILYRLLALSSGSAPENAFRLGMMAFAASIFFRWRDMKQRQAYLDKSLRDALMELQKASVQPPTTVLMWLLVIWRTNSVQGGCDEALEEWFLKVMGGMGICSWPELHKVLKSVLWIDCLFDTSSNRILEPILENAWESH
ncbi:short-chain dehydrogenase reductase family [Fusarium sp. NRRL 52700]|nr:short-chain dehydrogenase reductase family [Fusarium sp. NRRL 52700]